jgi:hypothetical protein
MKEMFKTVMIDVDMLKLFGINMNELLTLIKIYSNTLHKQFFDYRIDDNDLQSLQDKKLIRIIGSSNYVLREIGIKIIEKTISIKIGEKNEDPITINEIDDIVDIFRKKFEGLKTGSMGDRNAVKEKLIRWRIENPDVTESQILEAVDNYIESQENLDYLQRADYFIYKRQGGTESSRLSIFVEELKGPKENSDWASKII